MRRAYFIFLGVSIAMTLILLTPWVGIIVAFLWGFLFLGTGTMQISILFAPTAAIGLLSLLPLALMRGTPTRRWLATLATVALAAAILFGPNYFARNQAASHLANAPQQPAQAITGALPAGVEFIRTLRPRTNYQRNPVFNANPCDNICQGLLLGGDVDWVRIRPPDDALGNDRVDTTQLFTLAEGPECNSLYAPMPIDRPCIVFRDDTMGNADLVVDIRKTQEQGSWGKPDLSRVTPGGQRVAQARFGPGKDAPIAFLHTQVFYQIIDWKLGVEIGRPDTFGSIGYAPASKRSPAIDIPGELTRLGLTLTPPNQRTKPSNGQNSWSVRANPWQNVLDPQQSVLVASLLQTTPQGGDAPRKFANAKSSLVSDWLSVVLLFDTIPDEDLRIICAIKADNRVRSTPQLNRLEKNRGPLSCP